MNTQVDKKDKGLGLAEALESLRQELQDSAEKGESEKLKFRIEGVTLELTLVASTKAGGKAGIKWMVLSAEAGGEASEAITQKVTLSMDVIDRKTNEQAEVAGPSSGPRRAPNTGS